MEALPLSGTTKDERQVVLECPKCLSACSPDDYECAGCGFRFKLQPKPEQPLDRTIHFDPAHNRRYTNTVTAELGAGANRPRGKLWAIVNLAVGIFFVLIGAGMAYAMPFGFECGMIFVFLGAVLMLNVYLTFEKAYKRIEGCCPSCGEIGRISIGKSKTSAISKCQACKQTFHYDGARFEESGTA